jgi:hypothetical protein
MPQRSRRRSPLSSGTPQRMCRASSTVTPRVRTFRCQTERRSAGCPGTCAGGFCCLIGFRWQPGTEALPGYCLGHIGCTVVPWKQRRGYATEALRLLLPDTKAEGLRCVEVTTDIGNAASQRVIEANGGVLVARFTKPPSHGGTEAAVSNTSGSSRSAGTPGTAAGLCPGTPRSSKVLSRRRPPSRRVGSCFIHGTCRRALFDPVLLTN